MVTLDTNIIIAYLGGDGKVIARIQEWKKFGFALFILTVAECEVLFPPKLSTAEIERIEHFLKENFVVLPFDTVIAQRAAYIRRTIPSVKLPDAAIAALALERHMPLITRNSDDFRKIPCLKLVTI